jgi:hypothetical protein
MIQRLQSEVEADSHLNHTLKVYPAARVVVVIVRYSETSAFVFAVPHLLVVDTYVAPPIYSATFCLSVLSESHRRSEVGDRILT